ncbi:MAG: hypothetical protein ACE5I1_21785, partial [bacterium]
MKTRITLIVMLLLTVALFWHGIGCKKNPVAPPDPRHLTWTVDTLRYPDSFQTLMYGIWGSSPNDVYAVGHTNVVRGNMYHYNGKSWQDVLLASGWGGNIRGSFSLSG